MTEPRSRIEMNYDIALKRRSRYEILCDFFKILSQGPVKPTHVLSASGLNYNRMQEIISLLMEKGLIIEHVYMTKGRKKTKRKAYALSDVGFILLEKMQEVMIQVDSLI